MTDLLGAALPLVLAVSAPLAARPAEILGTW